MYGLFAILEVASKAPEKSALPIPTAEGNVAAPPINPLARTPPASPIASKLKSCSLPNLPASHKLLSSQLA